MRRLFLKKKKLGEFLFLSAQELLYSIEKFICCEFLKLFMALRITLYTRIRVATLQRAVNFIANAVIISILTTRRSRQASSNDVTVVQGKPYRHDSTAEAITAVVGGRLITHTNGTFPQSLTNCQLQAEYGNTLN
jgi:hypothetical protein